MIKMAADQEGHADNAVPAIVGGLTTVMKYEEKIYYQQIKMPENITIIVAVPDFELPTYKSRQVLPETLTLAQSVANVQKACMLLAGIFNRDFRYMNKAMDDQIYQPYRKQFIPGFDEVLNSAGKAGALGVALSGAGPSIIAFAEEHPEMIGRSMAETLAEHNVSSQILYLKTNHTGVQID
jgi:homoserine kinase